MCIGEGAVILLGSVACVAAVEKKGDGFWIFIGETESAVVARCGVSVEVS